MKPLPFSSFSPQERIKIVIATLGGVGFTPKIPGTAGSLLALVPILLLVSIDNNYNMAFILGIGIALSFLLGLWSVPVMEAHWGNDPGCVVIDELLGMWAVLLFTVLIPIFSPSLPQLTVWMMVGFVLFRLFDIAKPFPISWLNGQKGAFFVMIDDVLAGIYACGGLFLLWLIWQQFGK